MFYEQSSYCTASGLNCYFISFILGQYPSGIVYSQCTTSCLPPDPENCLFPTILIWNPIMTFQHLFPEKGIKCPHGNCNKLATTVYWNDGSTQYRQPRLIHDIKDVVLLISAVYMCEDRHKTLAHDPRVLGVLPKTMIPFFLLYRSGFSCDLVDLVMSICPSGMNFHSLEAAIKKIRWENYLRRKGTYESIVKHHMNSINSEHACKSFFDFKQTRMGLLPTDDAISNCFLSKFLKDETFYLNQLQKVNTGGSLSFDHTFRVAANIGYLRKDKRWVPQYDSVFFVMNSQRKIVSWQFTKGTAFKQVKDLLTAVCQRAINQGNEIKKVHIDNCCQWQMLVCSVFGNETEIKLDIFHAIQRVAKTMSKKHSLYSYCMNDLKLVFRQKEDQGDKRTKETPEVEELSRNLDQFLVKWKSQKDGDHHVLSAESIHEIDKLKIHAKKGCLSGIEVGGGTNCNEAFHRHINTFFHKSRIGTLHAYALLMLVIFHFNNRDKKSFTPVDSTTAVTPSLPTEVMGILPNDYKIQQDQSIEDNFDFDSMDNIICTSISQFLLSDAIQKQTKTANIPFMYIPYMHSLKLHELLVPAHIMLTDDMNDTDDMEEHKTRLKNLLKSWNYILEPVTSDGNCFFTAISLNLIHDPVGNKKY